MYKLMNQGVMQVEGGGYSKPTITVAMSANQEPVEVPVEYVMRDSDLALIPCTLGNADYAQYLEDVAAGATVTNYDYAAEEARQSAALSAISVTVEPLEV